MAFVSFFRFKPFVAVTFVLFLAAFRGNVAAQEIRNSIFSLFWEPTTANHITYVINENGRQMDIRFPVFELDGNSHVSALTNLKIDKRSTLSNGVVRHNLIGQYLSDSTLRLGIELDVSPDNPILRIRYTLFSDQAGRKMTKASGKDNICYMEVNTETDNLKEVRLSTFNSRFHASHLEEVKLDDRHFARQASVMGPILVVNQTDASFLMAYEHGSQFPDRFFEFQLRDDRTVQLNAVRANYLADEAVDGFTTVWFEFGGVAGDEELLASNYRTFLLKYITQNLESRKPYVFYNTWGRQSRTYWEGEPYLSSMRLDYTLKEIDQAHAMGIDVYVLDVGWFQKTGDWQVNESFFPDGLKEVKAKLDSYGMKLGLWFNPTVAAITSVIYEKNKENLMTLAGKHHPIKKVWETEESTGICLVSDYWQDFADEMIRLSNQVGVSYFKWDAIEQYGCDDPNHHHGTAAHSAQDRSDRYGYLLSTYMSRIIDRVCAERPECIFDFDITEPGRSMGLQFLSSGKYFIMNNGPYYRTFGLQQPGRGSTIFVNPGPTRGWFTRSILTYDKWIPSILFLTHYQPDEPRSSQLINVASLILGQNGIWGEPLKTSPEGTAFIRDLLDRYKLVRDDITNASLQIEGEVGDSPEIYEKIDPESGKGCIVIFSNRKGNYEYISKNKVSDKIWQSGDAEIVRGADGIVSIEVAHDKPAATILFFGTD